MDVLIAQSLHWLVALLPVLLLLGIFVWLDAFALMRPRELALLLAGGAVAAALAYGVAGLVLQETAVSAATYSKLIAPWVEEALKGTIVLLLFRTNRIGYKLDAVLSGFAIGAGFSLVENVVFLVTLPLEGIGTWMVRGCGTALMHGTTTALLATIAHECAERESRGAASEFDFRWWWFLPGYLIAVSLHMIFNLAGDRPLLAMIGALVVTPVALMLIFHLGQVEATEWLKRDYAGHRAASMRLAGGAWPDDPAGVKIAALAARLPTAAAQPVRDHYSALVTLAAEAEEAMLEESAGDVSLDRERVAQTFATLDSSREAMGRSAYAALRPLLPFSRNDLWEIAELRQRIGTG